MRYFLLFIICFLFSNQHIKAQCGVGEIAVGIEIDATGNMFADGVYWRLFNVNSGQLVAETFPGDHIGSLVDTTALCLSQAENYRLELYEINGNSWNGIFYRILYTDGFVLNKSRPDDGVNGTNSLIPDETYFFTAGARPGDNCSLPRAIKVGAPYDINTEAYSNEYLTDALFDSGREAIFQFTPPLTDNYSIQFYNIFDDVRSSIQLYNACLDALPTRIAFDSTGLAPEPLEIIQELVGGASYYIVVSNNPDFTGFDYTEGTIAINYVGTPANDDCTAAINLVLDGPKERARMQGATGIQAISIGTKYGEFFASGNTDIYYSFGLANQENVVIQVENYPYKESLFMELFQANNCFETPVANYQRAQVQESTLKRFTFSNLAAGNYFFRLIPDGFTTVDFVDVSLRSASSLGPPSYQNCSAALSVPSEFVDIEASPQLPISWLSFYEANNSGIGAPCGQDSIFSAVSGDVWIKTAVPASRNLVVETYGEYYNNLLSPDQAIESRWAVYTGTCGNLNEVFCSDKYENHQLDTVANLPANEEVFIRLFDRNGGNQGEIGVRLFEPIPLYAPSVSASVGPTTLDLFLSGSFDYLFDYGILVSADSFNTFLPGFNPLIQDGFTSSVTVTGLNPVTKYFVKVWTQAEGLTNSDTTVMEFTTAPYFINSVQAGNWTDPNTWFGGVIPPADSAANVQHRIVINPAEIIDIHAVTIQNLASTNKVGIWMENAALHVASDLLISDQNGFGTVDSMGVFMRNTGLGNSNLIVQNNLEFYKFSATSGVQLQLLAFNTGNEMNINVGKDVNINYFDNDSLRFYNENIYMDGVNFSVGNAFNISTSIQPGQQPISFKFNNSLINSKNITINEPANTNGKLSMNFSGNSVLFLENGIERFGSGGRIAFNDSSSLHLTNTKYAAIPSFGSNEDSIIFNHIYLNLESNNEGGSIEPGELYVSNYIGGGTSQLFIKGNFTFVNGIVDARNSPLNQGIKTVNFGAQANAIGANPNSYIDGSVIKYGNNNFTYPVGHQAGLRQLTLSNNGGMQATDYLGVEVINNFCGDSTATLNIPAGLARSRSKEYWEIKGQLLVSDQIFDFQPSFSDLEEQGITDLASLRLLDLTNAVNLGNIGQTDSSFGGSYNFLNGANVKLGIGSNLAGENPFYYQRKINSFSALSAAPGDVITLNLSGNFGGIGNQIYFGDKAANALSSTGNTVEVVVPFGARSGAVKLLNSKNKIYTALQSFTVSNSQVSNISAQNYGNLTPFNKVTASAQLGTAKLKLGQIDADGRFDAYIVIPESDSVKIVKDLGGASTLEGFMPTAENIVLKPIDFNIDLSNIGAIPSYDISLFVSFQGVKGLVYFENDGNGNFSPVGDGAFESGVTYSDALIEDLDYDGYSDGLFSFDQSSPPANSVLEFSSPTTEGCSPFVEVFNYFEPSNQKMDKILQGNYQGASNSEIAYLVNEQSRVAFVSIYNTNPPIFSHAVRNANEIYEIINISLNGDGLHQIIASNQIQNQIEIISYDGIITNVTNVSLGFKPGSLVAEDINGDGFQDLLVASQDDPSLHLLLNDGLGNLTLSTQFDYPGSAIVAFDVADINEDGFKDIIILQANGRLAIAYYEIANLMPPAVSASNLTTNSFDLGWGTVEAAVAYEIKVSLENDSLSNLPSDSIFFSSDTLISIAVPQPFQTYYVFGRSIYATGDTSIYSTALTVALDTLAAPSPLVTNINPNGFNINWPKVAGADQYELFIGLENDVTSMLPNDSLFVVADTSVSFVAPQYAELYYLYVRSIASGIDTSAFSPVDSIKLPVSAYMLQDSMALVTLYEETGGTNWINKENWLTGKLNTWYGLTMDFDSLKNINLSGNGLLGALPIDMADLNVVENINFANNSLTNISSITPLSATLISLNVSNNLLNFEQLEPFSGVSIFTFDNQNFQYELPNEILENLNASIEIQITDFATNSLYQWFKNGELIEGEINFNLLIDSAQTANEGIYYAEISNSLLNGLFLRSNEVELKISTIVRDVAALRALFDQTGGPAWEPITWDTSSEDPREWNESENDVIIENNRVVEINLPDNNLTGSVPLALREILGFRKIDLSNNAIIDLPDLSNLPDITELNVSANALDYGDLEPNILINGFLFDDQANFGMEDNIRIPQGAIYSIAYQPEGSSNLYQWYRNNEVLTGEITNTLTIDSINYSNMGAYVLEVKNEIVNAIFPDFNLSSNTVNLFATNNIIGTAKDANNFPTENGEVYLFEIIESNAFDTLTYADGAKFRELKVNGAFELNDVVLGNYLLYVRSNKIQYPDLINTYWQNTIDWDFADTLYFRNAINDLEVIMEGSPQDLLGTSVFSGFLEEEFEEEGRVLARRRVSNAGVSVRSLPNTTRGNQKIYANNELVAYIETDENGEFEFPDLPAGDYLVKIDYPGIPMNESSDIRFTFTGEDQERLEVAALIDAGQISVDRLRYTANKFQKYKELNIYPNPSSGQFKIRANDPLEQVRIFDVNGQLIYDVSHPSTVNQEFMIDVGQHAPGLYFIHISWGDGTKSMNKVMLR